MNSRLISVIWPYWDRQAVANESLRLFSHHYGDMDIELVIVDDGSQQPFVSAFKFNFPVRIVRLPKKDGPLSSCLPYNVGVMVAEGDTIVLSGADIRYSKPVIRRMMESLKGDRDYVVASCWMPSENRYVAHSTLRRGNVKDVGDYLPYPSGYHFNTMLRRSLWNRCGGFDNDYRQGAGYEDADFVRRLHAAGANFIMRDDLATEHIRDGARSFWTKEQLARNRELFLSKWEPMREQAAA